MVLSLRRLGAQHRRGAAPVASPDRTGRREPGHEKGVQVVKLRDLKPGARFSVLATGLRGVLVNLGAGAAVVKFEHRPYDSVTVSLTTEVREER